MKKLNFRLILFLLFVALELPAGAQQLSAQQEAVLQSEVNATFTQMLVYAEKLNYEQLNSGVNDSRAAGFITNGNYYAHYDTLIADMKANAQDVDRQDISIKEKKTTVLSDKLALMTVTGTATVYLTDGRVLPVNFHWSFVFEKMGKDWKVIHSHQSRAS
ncbi:nuclear transport factor 2 family protein [Mangrovibacterium lignilyticum]|uniref:nuclear transport factor 2 family protein n=1 Tax=Mangrovibacterium lignilyticum TaxID=2668052 RepID=UPI0013D62278|nr:nuclear transport factor 2 family protein [Mangrovibacterium lignilyticum]